MHSSPYRKFQKCAARVLIRSGWAEGIAHSAVEINFQNLPGVIGCIQNFQDVTCVIRNVTFCSTQKTGKDIG